MCEFLIFLLNDCLSHWRTLSARWHISLLGKTECVWGIIRIDRWNWKNVASFLETFLSWVLDSCMHSNVLISKKIVGSCYTFGTWYNYSTLALFRSKNIGLSIWMVCTVRTHILIGCDEMNKKNRLENQSIKLI